MKKKKERIINSRFSRHLTKVILILVSIIFLITYVIFAYDVAEKYRSREIESQIEQVNRTAAQIASLQSTVKNISLMVVYNDNVQTKITSTGLESGKQLYAIRNINDTLKEYVHVIDGTEEIMIYTEDGRTFTSRYTRGDFNAKNSSWYQHFIASGRNSGYTQIHKSVPTSGGYTIDVISYVTNYYRISSNSQKLGELFINIDFSKIQEMVNFDSKMLTGYCLYDYNGKPLVRNGVMNNTYKDIVEKGNGIYEDKRGEIYVISKSMEDGWVLVSEISAKALLQQTILSMLKMLFTFILLWVALAFILRYFIGKMVNPINRLIEAVALFGKGNLSISVNDINSNDEIGDLANSFNQMVVDINNLMKESEEHQEKMQKMQTENLMLQINPHFIYNTMNSIVYMAMMEGNKKIADFTNAFISLLQNTLRVRSSIYSSVDVELKTVRNYLYLQEYRYDNKFTYSIDCEDSLLNCQMLNVMLQPVVENAIFHGIAPKPGVGKITISICHVEDFLKIVIADDGVGMNSATVDEILKTDYIQNTGVHKIGIGNVRQRILDIYGKPSDLSVESQENVGTTVTIKIPYRMLENEKKE